MTASHDLERRLADFYATEPPMRAPDRVLGNALTTIESTPQRRVLALAPWRFRPLNAYSKLAIAAVAIVAATFAVRSLLPSSDIGTPTPPPTATTLPSSTPDALPTPSETAAPLLPGGDRVLAPGRYTVPIPDAPGLSAELAATGGEWRGNDWYLSTGATSVSFWTVANVYADACDRSSDPEPPTGPTVDDLAAALDAQASTDLVEVTQEVIGGYPSTRAIIRPSAGLTAASCPEGLLRLWLGPDRKIGRSIDLSLGPNSREDVVWIVDVAGRRVVIVAYYFPDAPEAASISTLLDSIEFRVP